MNAQDVMMYGHFFLMDALAGVPEAEWQAPDVCGWWSVKDIVAHLTSFEHVLEEVLGAFLDGSPTSYLDEFRADPQAFNDHQVDLRSHLSPAATRAEYEASHARVRGLAARIPAETFRRAGSLPWYGLEYDLDDFIAYTYYGHKREHGAQVNIFKDTLNATAP